MSKKTKVFDFASLCCGTLLVCFVAFGVPRPVWGQVAPTTGSTGTKATKPLPTDAAALAAANRFLSESSYDKRAEDGALVMDFAERSPKVTIEIDTRYLDLKQKMEEMDSLLLWYFVAGGVRYDLQNPAKAKDALADKPASVRAMLVVYKRIRVRQPTFRRGLLDKFVAAEAKGQLESYLRTLAKQK